ncbi:MAG: hypothetical protein AAF585_15270, partial [Verrucomicrobiota bacterium]
MSPDVSLGFGAGVAGVGVGSGFGSGAISQNTYYGIDAGNGPGMVTIGGIYIAGNYNTSIGYKAGDLLAGTAPKNRIYNVFLGHLTGANNT